MGVGTFLPDKYSAADAAKLYQPVCVGSYPCSGTTSRRGMNPALVSAGVAPDARQHRGRAVHRPADAGLEPVQRHVPGRPGRQRHRAVRLGVQACRRASAWSTTSRAPARRSCAAAGASSTTGRRATSCSTWRTTRRPCCSRRSSTACCRTCRSAARRPEPDPGHVADGVRLRPAVRAAVERRHPAEAADEHGVRPRLRRVEVREAARAGPDQRGAARRALAAAATRIRPSRRPGNNPLPDDLLRPYKGYGGIRMWDYRGYSNYHGMNTGVTKRYDKGYMFSAFYVWSKALGTANSDWGARVPYSTDEENRAVNYSYLDYDRPHNFVINAIYQVPKVTENKAAGHPRSTTGSCPASTAGTRAGRTPSGTTVSGVDLTGGTDVGRSRRGHLRPGQRLQQRPVQAVRHVLLQGPERREQGRRVGALLHAHAGRSTTSTCRSRRASRSTSRRSSRSALDAFNALNHTQFTTINSTAQLRRAGQQRRSRTWPTTRPGSWSTSTGFGTINGVAPPRTFQIMTRFTF